MSGQVHIIGMGVISALGETVSANLDALLAERTGIGPIARLDTRHRGYLPAAEVRSENEALAARALPADPRSWTRTALLALIAAREAIAEAGLAPRGQRTGLISATTVGGMDSAELIYPRFFDDDAPDEVLRFLGTHDPGDHSERVARELGIEGCVTTISTACSSSANAIMLGARLIRAGRLDVAVVGGADALSRFTVNGFNSLMILDDRPCTPFDRDRRGLNLGEAAAYLVIASDAYVEAHGVPTLARVSGYANTNDAFHATASSPEGEGAFLAMQGALRRADLAPTAIDHINVHGTGTLNNDASEGRALVRLFGGSPPPFSSTKAFTGHTLGAAGAVEAVFATLAIRQGVMFANLRFTTPLEEAPTLVPVLHTREEQRIRHVLSSSFGFGGNNTSLVISAP
ncbi:MAG: beta-ketoacyl-[acyl-carrier-protein] synthase family protein [Flavobacteriales bacterium]|nr:beta-ketoacyl-[acyl-carrier-protein] synthase family protein [Flavobacteriales bacterium]MCB9168453.1 beta-ketoacyl-[acyl-carrier-protein] synthase family protein [Flavobacteriales bacterium]